LAAVCGGVRKKTGSRPGKAQKFEMKIIGEAEFLKMGGEQIHT
jgi:hypothetical protein